VLGLFAALLVVPGSSAKACSCALFQVTDAVANADVVLRGAISAKDDPGGGFSGRSVTYAVFVDRVYKGTAARTTYIRSAGDGGSCGIEVGIGMTYLLFPRVEGDDLVSGLCDGTTPATTEATAELRGWDGNGARAPGERHTQANGGSAGVTRTWFVRHQRTFGVAQAGDTHLVV
jgi:hypothetical protein